jgi:hypothetical protein
MKSAGTLYEKDFFLWTEKSAELLRAGRFSEADIMNIAQEIEDMGRSNKLEIQSRFAILVGHLLKWQFQTGARSRSWRATIDIQRIDLKAALKQMPSLRAYLADRIADFYPKAVAVAVRDTGLAKSAFPKICPYTIEQILYQQFLPS